MNIRRVYETTIIINASLGEQETEAAINKIIAYIQDRGGVVEEINKWGNRRLAYTISKKNHGYYMHLVYNILPVEVPNIERFLTLDDMIIRHLTLQLDTALREFRRQKSLAEGKSGETIISSVVEIEKITNVYGETEIYALTGEGIAEPVEDLPVLEEDDTTAII